MTSQDASSLLGTYLLQGWVMTDLICSKEDCGVPLMRSKDKSIQFCVVHDSLPTNMNSNHTNTTSKTKTEANIEYCKKESISTFEDKTNYQSLKPSTTTSTDIIDNVSVTPINNKDTDEFRLKEQRREQSSLASQLIGQRMLQRWVLLNETCPNDSCYAIPLIRHPSDKTMFCVICEQTYQLETDVGTISKPINNEIGKKQNLPTGSLNKNDTKDNINTQESVINSQLHTPLSTPPSDRSIKRQKKTEPDSPRTESVELSELKTPSPSSLPSITIPNYTIDYREEGRTANEYVIKCLSTKMRKMMDEVEACNDHYQLIKIVQAVEACSETIKTCTDSLDNM